ncbi:MAG TPA: septum formation inhibitor Maf [Leucothrix mucor]|nr:septum formation inhibitor Maf [Leucothrix mucor]
MIILASASPRRGELLDQIGVAYQSYPVDIDETPKQGESAKTLVQRLALEKAQTAYQRLQTDLPVLGSDTLGLLDNDILVKPRDFEHARSMLRAMSGATHEIMTAVAIIHQGTVKTALNINQVTFCSLSDAEIKAYWESGEPQDKAGAYAIQGKGAVFVKHIEGSYSGVMGLPLYEVGQLLNGF